MKWIGLTILLILLRADMGRAAEASVICEADCWEYSAGFPYFGRIVFHSHSSGTNPSTVFDSLILQCEQHSVFKYVGGIPQGGLTMFVTGIGQVATIKNSCFVKADLRHSCPGT